MDLKVFALGLLMFSLRCLDVSIGTMRTIAIVNGRILISFFLGFIEVSVWLFAISFVLVEIKKEPILALFYALGFAAGNVVGIYLERIIPIGNLTLRIFITESKLSVIDAIRNAGFKATSFEGSGRDSKVWLLFIFIKKKELKKILNIIKNEEGVFYTIDYGGKSKDKSTIKPNFDTSGWYSKKKFK